MLLEKWGLGQKVVIQKWERAEKRKKRRNAWIQGATGIPSETRGAGGARLTGGTHDHGGEEEEPQRRGDGWTPEPSS